MFNLDEFINKYVTKRSKSMFLPDLNANRALLSEKIKDKSRATYSFIYKNFLIFVWINPKLKCFKIIPFWLYRFLLRL